MYRKGMKEKFAMLHVACIQVERTWVNFLSSFSFSLFPKFLRTSLVFPITKKKVNPFETKVKKVPNSASRSKMFITVVSKTFLTSF